MHAEYRVHPLFIAEKAKRSPVATMSNCASSVKTAPIKERDDEPMLVHKAVHDANGTAEAIASGLDSVLAH